MTPELYCAFVAVLVAVCIGYLLGQQTGYHRGRGVGWQEGYFKQMENDKSRRDSGGRFVAIKAIGGSAK